MTVTQNFDNLNFNFGGFCLIKVLLADKLSQRALELLGEIPEFEIEILTGLSPEELKSEIKNYEAVVIRGGTLLNREILKEAKNLKLIVRAGIDLDNVDVDFAKSMNIEVRHTPAATSITVAEYTLARLLGICRFIGPTYKSMKEHKWEENVFSEGMELYGKTAGIIGFGRIGKEVAKREIAMGMNVVYYDILPIDTDLDARQVPLDELLKISDFISVHVPSRETTKHLISFPEFEKMKSNAVLINVTRGEVVDEKALLNALENDMIKAAAIDVHENEMKSKSELIDNDKIFPAPYLGALTVEGQDRAGLQVVSVLKEFFNV